MIATYFLGEEIGHFIQPPNQASVANQISNHDWRTVSTAASASVASEQPQSIHAAELIVGDKSQQGQVQQHQQVNLVSLS